MQYRFDVNERNNKYEIKLEIFKDVGFGTSSYDIIECPKNNHPIWPVYVEKLMARIIDNMRLTVNERMEVRNNSKILIDFLKNNFESADNKQEMIVENGDPAVVALSK